MAADSEGNDLGAVGVPITGFAAVQLTGGPTYVASADGKATPLVLPAGYEKIGLFKVDGGPAESAEDGDAIEFFQQGYKLAGDSAISVKISLAEFNTRVRTLIRGKAPDANGMIVVDRNIPDTIFPLFIATKFKNGSSLRRNGLARISAVEADQETRGEAGARAVTFEWISDATVGGFFREWFVPGSGSGAKASWDATITGTPTGGTFTLSLNGFATAPLPYNANAAAVAAALNALSGVTGVSGITASGTNPVTVVLPGAGVLTGTHAFTGGTSPAIVVA